MYTGIVNKIHFNWRQFNDSQQAGEDYDIREVGKNKVISIDYHEPEAEGDSHYCHINYEDKSSERIFNLNTIYFKSE